MLLESYEQHHTMPTEQTDFALYLKVHAKGFYIKMVPHDRQSAK